MKNAALVKVPHFLRLAAVGRAALVVLGGVVLGGVFVSLGILVLVLHD